MAIVLATDTTTDQCSVALCDADGVIAEFAFRGQRAHAERLMAAVDTVLDAARCRLDDVGLFAVSAGPGSFTGLRIGAAAWKGLAFATAKPLLGVPTLDALARSAAACELPVCALLDAKMDEVYAAWFGPGPDGPGCLEPAFVAPIATVMERAPSPALFIGDGALRYANEIRAADPDAILAPADLAYPRAAAVAMLGLARWRAGVPADPADFAPVYLRRSQAEENAARLARASAP